MSKKTSNKKSKKIKIILLDNVYNLGKKHDTCSVSFAYAVNVLIPKKIAIYHTDDQEKKIQQQKILLEKKIQKEVASFKKNFPKEIVFLVECEKDEKKIKGSVNAAMVRKKINDDYKLLIPVHSFVNYKPIRLVGDHKITVKHLNEIFSLVISVKKK